MYIHTVVTDALYAGLSLGGFLGFLKGVHSCEPPSACCARALRCASGGCAFDGFWGRIDEVGRFWDGMGLEWRFERALRAGTSLVHAMRLQGWAMGTWDLGNTWVLETNSPEDLTMEIE